MKIFLTTSHNQINQVADLYHQLKKNYEDLIIFVVVESGESIYEHKLLNDKKFHVIKTESNSFWGQSNAIGLKHIYAEYQDITFDLIILNCDVRLNKWINLKSRNELITYFTVNNGTVTRSGYCISNWFIAEHEYPFLGKPFIEATNAHVDIVPTRFIFIPNNILKTVWGIIPNYKKLPHYTSDLEFTYRIGESSKKKWLIDISTFIEEDYSTTGTKNISGSIKQRLKVLHQRKSIYNIRDRFWYSYLITTNKSLITRIGYITSSISKLMIQVFRP